MSTSSSSGYPTRAVLEGVPKVGYHRHLCPFPGSLFACLEYLGDPYPYDYLMGVTGAAFRRLWNRDDGGNVDLMHLAPGPDRQVFRALGYEYYTVPSDDKAAMMQAVRESIHRGIPAISFGIIGPPEAGLVTGYDRDGEVLYGYSYFQDGSLPGYYEKEDWFETMERANLYGLVLIGDRHPRPSEREILASALAWAIDLERSPSQASVPNHASGLAAYDGWADGMEVDADYPADDAEVLGFRVMILGDQAVMLDERRNAANFLRGMGEVVPEAASHLNAAATQYEQVASYMSGIWLWGFSMGPEVGRALADPETRRGIARHIRLARDAEAVGVEYLEKALSILM